MNKEYIKTILENNGKNDGLIKDGDYIDEELVKILSQYKKAKMNQAFYSYDVVPAGGFKYHIDIKCPRCEKLYRKTAGKIKIIEMIERMKNKSYNSDFFCSQCEAEIKNEEELKIKIGDRKFYEREQETCAYYIANYLSPNKKFNTNVSASEKAHIIMDIALYHHEFYEKIEEAVKSLDYRVFLNTPYWDGVRNYKFIRSKYRCELCGNAGKLNAHHKTYQNHGREHVKSVADNDLIVLCQECHRKFHDKLYSEE